MSLAFWMVSSIAGRCSKLSHWGSPRLTILTPKYYPVISPPTYQKNVHELTRPPTMLTPNIDFKHSSLKASRELRSSEHKLPILLA